MRSWYCWGNSWCRCLLCYRVWQCYQGKWTLQLLKYLLYSLRSVHGIWNILHCLFYLLLTDLHTLLLCKHAETCFSLAYAGDQRWVIGEFQFFKGWEEGPFDAPCQSDVVCHITQSVVTLKRDTEIEQPCLTPVLTLKLDSLFPTLHLKLL